jgi:hypothetical protein
MNSPSIPSKFQIISNGVLLTISTAVTLLMLELGVRLMLDAKAETSLPYAFVSESTQRELRWIKRQLTQVDSFRYSFDEPDPLLGWRVKPNVSLRSVKSNSYDVAVTSNTAGLRNIASDLIENASGLPRIGIFGCSLTFGEGVNDEETYSAGLQRMLPNTQVLNFGVHGYGTDQMLLKLEGQGQTFELDYVVLAFAWFHMERNMNDFHFFSKPRYRLTPDGQLELQNTPVPTPDELIKDRNLTIDSDRFIDRSVLLRWVWQRYRNFQISRLYKSDSEAWGLTKALITRFVQTAKQSGAKVLLLSVDESHPELDGLLKSLSDELGAGFLNIGEGLKSVADGKSYRLNNDAHWNAYGHTIVAEKISHYLCQKNNIKGGCSITKSPQ